MNCRLTILIIVASLYPGVAQTGAQSAGKPRGEPLRDAPYLREPGWRPLLNGRDLTGWHGRVCSVEPIDRGDRSPSCLKSYPFEWFVAKAVVWDAATPEILSAAPGAGDEIVNGPKGQSQDLLSDEKYGDLELYLEFMVARGSNSGVYMQGHYEVQLFDSFGQSRLQYGSSGGIYRAFGKPGSGTFAGSPPRENAAKVPGEWQSLRIWFQAPRFDAEGKKTRNARFLRILYNGALVQENVEVDGPTMSAMGTPEAATGPVMLQGDHGPIAFRNIYTRPLRPLL
jgi:hypothetical protein